MLKGKRLEQRISTVKLYLRSVVKGLKTRWKEPNEIVLDK